MSKQRELGGWVTAILLVGCTSEEASSARSTTAGAPPGAAAVGNPVEPAQSSAQADAGAQTEDPPTSALSGAGTSANPAMPKCEQLTVSECKLEDDCGVVLGQSYDAQRGCVNPEVEVGCYSHTEGCSTVVSYANDPQGTLWRFADSCLPYGWQRLASVAYEQWPPCVAAGARPCPDLSVEDCKRTSGCAVIAGEPLDLTNACRGPRAEVGCRTVSEGCGAAITFARDSQGTWWQFNSLCVPGGWTATPSFEPPLDPVRWSECGQP